MHKFKPQPSSSNALSIGNNNKINWIVKKIVHTQMQPGLYYYILTEYRYSVWSDFQLIIFHVFFFREKNLQL